MTFGKKKIVVKKLETTNIMGNVVSQDFDIKDIAETMGGYSIIPDECKIDVKENDLYLVLVFNKNNTTKRATQDIENVMPYHKA